MSSHGFMFPLKMDHCCLFDLIHAHSPGSNPTVSEEKNTTGGQLYLSKDSLETAITTAKSSEINVMVPGASPDGD
ncbi:hypothetical protein F2Q70_00033485 [Brassica cretica]|uniref:Adenylate cyclase-associated CAP C-terminal domain-containing protein n=1 Tax=Brassica cretica TaxID=69181 RepID=A0A8S9FHG5_BRACR|nr:hypothetical protein F2Q70_00033485 [Brassica cretica]